jgi:uncharacterized integral membrane protein
MGIQDDHEVPQSTDAEQGGETVAAEAALESIPSTRASRAWVRVLPALIVLAVTLVFVFQNSRHVKVSFFNASGTVPLSVALLGAAALGALLVLALGSVRILQLRRRVQRRGQGHND